jgi:hypothetical protein
MPTPAPTTTTAPKLPLWLDVFSDPDIVGSSEYRAMIELLLDANDVRNIGGEIPPNARITKQMRDHSIGVLSELVDRATEAKKDLNKLQF